VSDLVERLRNRIHDAPISTEFLLDEAAARIEAMEAALENEVKISGEIISHLKARIEALEAALRKIEQKLTTLNAGWASEGGPFDGEWVSEIMALAPEQDK
jgi:hypothetical protein